MTPRPHGRHCIIAKAKLDLQTLQRTPPTRNTFQRKFVAIKTLHYYMTRHCKPWGKCRAARATPVGKQFVSRVMWVSGPAPASPRTYPFSTWYLLWLGPGLPPRVAGPCSRGAWSAQWCDKPSTPRLQCCNLPGGVAQGKHQALHAARALQLGVARLPALHAPLDLIPDGAGPSGHQVDREMAALQPPW